MAVSWSTISLPQWPLYCIILIGETGAWLDALQASGAEGAKIARNPVPEPKGTDRRQNHDRTIHAEMTLVKDGMART